MSSGWTEYDYNPGVGSGSTGGDYGSSSSGFYDGAGSAYSTDQPSFMTPAPVGGDGYGFGGGANGGGGGHPDDEFANEPPLLEELGINVEHIVQKTLAVLNPFRATRADVAGDSDLAGPLVFCLAFGSLLLLVGKVHFNYIYGIGVLGCLAMWALLSMMSVAEEVRFTVIVSVLGYCVLPIVALSALSVVASLQGAAGNAAAAAAVAWCAASSSKLFVTAFGMEHQQLLVAYPCALLYAVFALLTVF